MLVISERQVRNLLSPDDLLSALEHALIGFSCGQAVQPVRTTIDLPSPHSFACFMPAFTANLLGAKVVTVCPDNSDTPTHDATVFLWDPLQGGLQAMVGGRYLTEARTAAVSALSMKALARDDSATLGILGSGVQARGHLEFLPRLRAFQRILAWSPNGDRLERFVKESGGKVEAARSAEQVARAADVLVLATSSPVPVVEAGWIRPGTHVISIGAARPDQTEMDPALLPMARLYVDSCAAALVESGDILQAIRQGRIAPDHIRGELGEVLGGSVLGRETEREITIFKSLGLAVEDVTAAALVYWRARALAPGRDGERVYSLG